MNTTSFKSTVEYNQQRNIIHGAPSLKCSCNIEYQTAMHTQLRTLGSLYRWSFDKHCRLDIAICQPPRQSRESEFNLRYIKCQQWPVFNRGMNAILLRHHAGHQFDSVVRLQSVDQLTLDQTYPDHIIRHQWTCSDDCTYSLGLLACS